MRLCLLSVRVALELQSSNSVALRAPHGPTDSIYLETLRASSDRINVSPIRLARIVEAVVMITSALISSSHISVEGGRVGAWGFLSMISN